MNTFIRISALILCSYLYSVFACIPEASFTPCPRCTYNTTDALDECYMQIALDLAEAGGGLPFASVIVDSYLNIIRCTGVSNTNANAINHGERVAIDNCTAMYPPLVSDRYAPTLYWPNLTMYTTGEPCAMCVLTTMVRNLGGFVFGSTQEFIIRLGLPGIQYTTEELIRSGKMNIRGTMGTTGGIGELGGFTSPNARGPVLSHKTDKAFFRFFGLEKPTSPFFQTDRDIFHRTLGKKCCHGH